MVGGALSALRVGLVGAGPWANLMHAPMLTGGPETELVGVWARRPEAADELARKHSARTFSSFEQLLEECDAVAFAVPPTVQPEYAIAAAAAGKAVLLEKPVAADLAEAERVAAAVAEAGVGSLVSLTFHLCPEIAGFLEAARGTELIGGRALFVTSGAFGGPFATPWRLEGGTLIDLAPHLVDIMVTALGPVVAVHGVHGGKEWWSAMLEHENGALSDLSISSHSRVTQRTDIEFFGPHGSLAIDGVAAMGAQYERFQQGALHVLGEVPAFNEMRRQFARAAHERSHELDVNRGVELQRVIAAIELDVASGGPGTSVPGGVATR
jgi:predicted dehydrogenase